MAKSEPVVATWRERLAVIDVLRPLLRSFHAVLPYLLDLLPLLLMQGKYSMPVGTHADRAVRSPLLHENWVGKRSMCLAGERCCAGPTRSERGPHGG